MRWNTIPLGEVVRFVRGVTYKPADVLPDSAGGVACLRTKNIQSTLDLRDLVYIRSDVKHRPEQRVRRDDVLISSANSWHLVGKAVQAGAEAEGMLIGGFIGGLRFSPDVDPRYGYYWFSSPTVQGTVRSFGQQTTNISNLNVDRTLRLSFPLPPLPEQRRIAAILDEADALRARLDSRVRALRELPLMLFRHQFAASAEYTRVPLRTVSTKIGSGATPRGGRDAYLGGATTLIRSMNVHDNRFERDGLVQIDEAQAYALRNAAVEPLDVLLNITGASVARVCNAPLDVLPARVNQHVAIIRTTSDLDPIFLAHQLAGSSAKRRLLHGASNAGATREAITKADIERFEVFVPPVAKQIQFRGAVISAGDSLRSVDEERRKLKELFASLQHRAFRGEL